MDGGLLGSLVTVGAGAIGAPIWWAFRRLFTKIDLLEKTLEAKNESIQLLREQVSEQRITAQLQDRFFSQLPPKQKPSGD